MTELTRITLIHYAIFLPFNQTLYPERFSISPYVKLETQYLKTNLSFQLLQSVFFTICFLNDIIGTNEKNPKTKPLIRKVKDIVSIHQDNFMICAI